MTKRNPMNSQPTIIDPVRNGNAGAYSRCSNPPIRNLAPKIGGGSMTFRKFIVTLSAVSNWNCRVCPETGHCIPQPLPLNPFLAKDCAADLEPDKTKLKQYSVIL